MSGKYLKSTACQYPNYEPVPTTPSGSIPSVRPSGTSRSIHRDRDILVALLEKDVQEVGVRNKALRKAEVVVQAANTQLGEQLDRVEQNIEGLRRLTSPPSTPAHSQKIQHLASAETSRIGCCSPLPTSTSQHNPPSTMTRSQKVQHPASPATYTGSHRSPPATSTSPQPRQYSSPLTHSQKVQLPAPVTPLGGSRSPLPTSTSHQRRQHPSPIPTQSGKVQPLALPETSHGGLHSPIPALTSSQHHQSALQQPKSANLPKQEPTLVWISSDEDVDFPDDSEDSKDSRDEWAPVSAAEVSSDEEEPLPGPGGVTIAE
ncbi:MAG: hypothetical protein NXY57DRAFT_967917, partial [Lentinula lateritia]